MPSWIEFRLAVQGLLRLARLNPDFLRFFDLSSGGALRSFWIALPYYPYYLLQIWPIHSNPAIPDMTRYLVTMSVAYFYLWLLPPCILTWVAPFIGRRDEMPGCIAVYNWMTVLWIAVSWPVQVLVLSGAPSNMIGIVNDVVILGSLVWETLMLMRALRLMLWQAGLAAIADYFVMQRIVMPLFYLAGAGS